ncbi:MAG TPA: transcriptional regulator [Rhodanobacteraceae bacterium]|jgi:DNA-binding transcriptional ArsR family regulator
MNAVDDLATVFDHRVRLAIGVLLVRHGEVSFARLKQQLDLTDGNLGAHLRKLEDADSIALRRDFVDRKPVTWYALTKAGRRTLNLHLRALRSMIDGMD